MVELVRLWRHLWPWRAGPPPNLRLPSPRKRRSRVWRSRRPEARLQRAMPGRGRCLVRMGQLVSVYNRLYTRPQTYLWQPGTTERRPLLPGKGYHQQELHWRTMSAGIEPNPKFACSYIHNPRRTNKYKPTANQWWYNPTNSFRFYPLCWPGCSLPYIRICPCCDNKTDVQKTFVPGGLFLGGLWRGLQKKCQLSHGYLTWWPSENQQPTNCLLWIYIFW